MATIHQTSFAADNGWVFDAVFGGRTMSYGGRTDSWALQLMTQWSPRGLVRESAARTIAAEVAALCTVHCWAYCAEGARALRLEVENPTDSGQWTELSVIEAATASTPWSEASGSFVAAGASFQLRLRPDGAGTEGEAVTIWVVDDVEVESMAITAQIRAAVIDDLKYISTANGFSATLSEVASEPKRIDDIRTPGVALTDSPGGGSQPEGLGNQKAAGTQRITVRMVVHSSTPCVDLDNLLDDVRNAVERSGSYCSAVSGVYLVGVEEWTEVKTDREISEQFYTRDATIVVNYIWQRGAA